MRLFWLAIGLIKATGAWVLVVHHGGKDTDKNEIGNEGLRNASDTVIHIRRKISGVDLINEQPKGKQKDWDEFKTIRLQPVKVHYEQNGKELTTLILNIDAAPEPGSDEPDDNADQKLGSVEKKIIAALEDMGIALGLTSLVKVTGSAKGTVHTSLSNLVLKKKIKKYRSKDGTHDVWGLI